jgi:hypothetical protein
MSAINYILAPVTCPNCGRDVTVKAQAHNGASFHSVDGQRLAMNEYLVGQSMKWYQPEDGRYSSWINPESVRLNSGAVAEACHAQCPVCAVELCVVIEFEPVKATRVVFVATADKWPVEFVR